MGVVFHDVLNLPARGRRLADLSFTVEVAVPILGTTKILYMRGFRLFAMYVRTEPVHTYIAKSLKHAICAILYGTKVAVDTLSTTIYSDATSSMLIKMTIWSNQISWSF